MGAIVLVYCPDSGIFSHLGSLPGAASGSKVQNNLRKGSVHAVLRPCSGCIRVIGLLLLSGCLYEYCREDLNGNGYVSASFAKRDGALACVDTAAFSLSKDVLLSQSSRRLAVLCPRYIRLSQFRRFDHFPSATALSHLQACLILRQRLRSDHGTEKFVNSEVKKARSSGQ